MGEFTIIKGGLKRIEQKEKESERHRALRYEWLRYAATFCAIPKSEEDAIKMLFAYVRYINMTWDYFGSAERMHSDDSDNFESNYKIAIGTFCYLKYITIKRFVQMFPIKKQYNGKENYFSTIILLKNEITSRSILQGDEFGKCCGFLSEYQNDDIQKFIYAFANIVLEHNFCSRKEQIRRTLGDMGWEFVKE